jgi:outer membrane protein assembly factor BamD (BamD/ComL family)
MRTETLTRWIALAAVCLAVALPSPAQMSNNGMGRPGEEEPALSKKEPGKSERKTPGFFHRPSRDDSASQLRYADGLRAVGKLRRATNEYLALVHEWHGSAEAPRAQLEAARLLLQRGRHARAFEEFQYLVDHFSGQFPYGEALDAQFRIANVILADRHLDWFGLKGFADPQAALPFLTKLVRNAPSWERAGEVHFRIALVHETIGELPEATDAYATVMHRHAASEFAPEAAYRRALCLEQMAKDSPRDESQCRAALSAMAAFIRDFPTHHARAEMDALLATRRERLAGMYYDRARFYDAIEKRPRSAIVAYEDFVANCPASEHMGDALKRLIELYTPYTTGAAATADTNWMARVPARIEEIERRLTDWTRSRPPSPEGTP